MFNCMKKTKKKILFLISPIIAELDFVNDVLLENTSYNLYNYVDKSFFFTFTQFCNLSIGFQLSRFLQNIYLGYLDT